MKNFERKVINTETIETFLSGHNPQKRIVNIEYNYKDNFVKLYYRDDNDRKCMSMEPFYPFIWARLNACLSLCNGNRTELKALMRKFKIAVKELSITNNDGVECEEMRNGYRYMFYATEPMSYSTFLDFFKKANFPVYQDKNNKVEKKMDRPYIAITPQEQYLISTGKRFFKGYEDYNELLRMIFDLETEGLDPKKDRIKLNGIKLNRPVTVDGKTYKDFERIFRITGNTKEEMDKSELKVIDTMFRIIYTFKPDVITAHNGENFDWAFIIERCNQLGTSIQEVTKPYFKGASVYKNPKETILKLGGEVETFHQTIVPGIVITDSLHAVRRAQAVDSNFLKADLKYSTKYLELVKKNRVYVPGDIIDKTLCDLEKHYAFNNENGDWYIYDPNYIEPELPKIIPQYNVEYFRNLINETNGRKPSKEEWYELNAEDSKDEPHITWKEYCQEIEEEKYPEDVTAEQLYEEYIESLKPKKKLTDKFILVTRNELREGYELVSGEYIVNRYLYDDLWECDKVELTLNQSAFNICKSLPLPFQKCCTMGTAGQWKSLMMAWSYENNLAIPYAENTGKFTGGLSRLLSVGASGPGLVKLDYNSLYPSIILTWAIEDEKDLSGATLKFLEYFLTTREKYKKQKKEADKIIEHYEDIINAGGKLNDEESKTYHDALAKFSSADKLQNLRKVFCNSFFGAYGSNNGAVYPWKSIKCAERTTCIGRQSLRLMISHFAKLGYKPIVGDSFTEDTPVFIKYKENGNINILPIKELINEEEIKVDELGREYDYSPKNYFVLCRSGWVEPTYIYRHKTDKDIYEIVDNNMSVEVTEDHSLFNSDKVKVKPSEINNETLLEYFTNEDVFNEEKILTLDARIPQYYAEQLANGEIDRVPMWFLNRAKYSVGKKFYKCFMENYREDIVYSKTCIAGLQYLKKYL